MKKLSSNVCGKLVLASLALVGVFSSCIKEDIGTTFETSDAEAVINVTVVDVATLNNVTSASEITASSSLSSAKLSTSGAAITIKGNKAIAEQVVTIIAKWNGYEERGAVKISPLLAGGKASYDVKIVIGEVISPEDIKYEARIVNETTQTFKGYLEGGTYSHDGMVYKENNSEFMRKGTVKFCYYTGGIIADEPALVDDDAHFTSQYAAALIKDSEYQELEGELPITVSAWSIYTVWQERSATVYEYETYRINTKKGTEEKIGSFMCAFATSTAAMYEEMAHPSAHGHYSPGHGHDDHGAGGNAGGGIVFAD